MRNSITVAAAAFLMVLIVASLSACEWEGIPSFTPTPAEESEVVPTPSPAEANQEKLDAAIQADDAKAIIEAMQLAKTGLIPEPEATQQWEEGSQALAKINQTTLDKAIQNRDLRGILNAMKFTQEGLIPHDRATQQWEEGSYALAKINKEILYAAIEAGDIEAIKGAMQFAESAPLPAADAQAQIRRAQEELSALLSTSPAVVPIEEPEEIAREMEELGIEIELLKKTLEPYTEGLPSDCSQRAWGISNYMLLIESQLAILRNAVDTLEYWLETPTTDVNRELKEQGIEMAQDTIRMSLEIIQRNVAELAEYLEKTQDEGCFSATEASLLKEQIDAVLVPLNNLALMFGN
jgi:hypothetical protein